MRGGLRFDELNVDAYAFTDALDAPLQYVADIQVPPHLLHVEGLALVSKRSVAGDDEGTGNPREIGCETLGHSVDEVLLLGIAADICERKYDEGKARGAELFRRR